MIPYLKICQDNQPKAWSKYQLKEKGYFVMTLHRPANVDEEAQLKNLIDEIVKGAKECQLFSLYTHEQRKC